MQTSLLQWLVDPMVLCTSSGLDIDAEKWACEAQEVAGTSYQPCRVILMQKTRHGEDTAQHATREG